MAYAVREIGEEAFIFSSDYPHEVSPKTCKHEVEELLESDELAPSAKEAILFRNAQRFYRLTEPASQQPTPAAASTARS